MPILDGNIVDDADLPNLKIWNILRSGSTSDCAYLWTQTRREDAQVCYAMTYQFFKNNKETTANPIRIEKEKQTGFSVGADVKPGDNVTLIKYTAIASSLYHERSELVEHSMTEAREAKNIGWNTLVEEHRRAWQEIWDETDVVIEGDPEAQQGIRYNIFQLYQTYRGDDPRLNHRPQRIHRRKIWRKYLLEHGTVLCTVFSALHSQRDCKELAGISVQPASQSHRKRP